MYRCIYVNIQKNQDLGAQLALRHLKGLQPSSEYGTHSTVKASFGLQVKTGFGFQALRLWLSGQTAELSSSCSLLARKGEERLVFHCRTSSASTAPCTSSAALRIVLVTMPRVSREDWRTLRHHLNSDFLHAAVARTRRAGRSARPCTSQGIAQNGIGTHTLSSREDPSVVQLRSHARPFDTSIKSHVWMILSTFGDKCPQNCSKNGETAPRPGTGYHHEGPSVDRGSSKSRKRTSLQWYLAHKKPRTPWDHHRALLYGPRLALFLMSEVPLYRDTSSRSPARRGGRFTLYFSFHAAAGQI